jgi:membrane protein
MLRVKFSAWNRIKQTRAVRLLLQAGREWYEDDTFTLGAALAYYAVFSIAPMVLVSIGVASLVFGRRAAEGQIVQQIEDAVGPTVSRAIEHMLQYGYTSGSGTVATVIGVVLLLFAATGLFVQLQESLNRIWGVQPKPGRGLGGVIKDRFWSFVVVLCIGGLFLASLVTNAALAALGRFVDPSALPGRVYLWQAFDLVISFAFFTLLFALVYQLLPDAKIAWKDVWVGAAVTALLFIVGNHLIGLYLGRSGVTSTYGAAGSLVVILLWVYYCSQVLLFGAEFTQVYACREGKPIEPADNAMPRAG